MKRQEFTKLLVELRKYTDYVNPNDKDMTRGTFGKWNTYLIGFESQRWFLVHASYEGDAMDTITDYAGNKGYNGLFCEESYEAELIKDAIEAGKDEEAFLEDFYMRSGNAGEWFEIPKVIEVLEKY